MGGFALMLNEEYMDMNFLLTPSYFNFLEVKKNRAGIF
jgi:hypothetical protein